MTEAATKLEFGGKTQDATAKLEFGGKTHEFKVRSGSVGPHVIDIASPYSTTGAFTGSVTDTVAGAAEVEHGAFRQQFFQHQAGRDFFALVAQGFVDQHQAVGRVF